MSLCCIGGGCILYSALIPLALWCLKWLVETLGSKSYIPDKWWNLLQSKKTQPSKKKTIGRTKPSCYSATTSTLDSSLPRSHAEIIRYVT
jgi:hypothetical protein